MGFLNGKDVNVVVHYEFEDGRRREDAVHIPCGACDLSMGGFFIFIFMFCRWVFGVGGACPFIIV